MMKRSSQQALAIAGSAAIALAGLIGPASSVSAKTHDIHMTAVESDIIIDGGGETKAIEARVKNIRTQIDEATSDYDKEKLQERVAKLAGGVGIIKVGAATNRKAKELFSLIDHQDIHPVKAYDFMQTIDR